MKMGTAVKAPTHAPSYMHVSQSMPPAFASSPASAARTAPLRYDVRELMQRRVVQTCDVNVRLLLWHITAIRIGAGGKGCLLCCRQSPHENRFHFFQCLCRQGVQLIGKFHALLHAKVRHPSTRLPSEVRAVTVSAWRRARLSPSPALSLGLLLLSLSL